MVCRQQDRQDLHPECGKQGCQTGWRRAEVVKGARLGGWRWLGRAGSYTGKTQVNRDEARRAFRTGKTGLASQFIVNIRKRGDSGLRLASAEDYICTLNSDVPLPGWKSDKLVCIGSYRFRAGKDIAQRSISRIAHFAKEEADISEGLEALDANPRDSFSWVLHSGAPRGNLMETRIL